MSYGREEEFLEKAYCLADVHNHSSRMAEAACSFSFQLEEAQKEIARLHGEHAGKIFRINEVCEEMVLALEFYADPETWIAVGLFPDPPCGEIMNDFSETSYGDKPGKRARMALGEF